MHVSFIKLPGDSTGYITLVSFDKHRSYSEIASILYAEPFRSKVNASEVLVLRPPVDIPLDSRKIKRRLPQYQVIVERFPFKPFYILYSWNFKIRLTDNINKAVNSSPVDQEFTLFLRQKELEEFIIDSSAILRSPTPEALYRTPSQEYSHVFLRVGNIQKNRHVLDSVFFWTLPHLKDAGALLTDSWSISSIALNIARLLARYVSAGAGSKEQTIGNFHVNMLSGFYHGLREMDQETRECLQPLLYHNRKNILFLISAIKTLKSLGNIKKALGKEGLEKNVKYLALYRLVPDIQQDHLCDLSGDFAAKQNVNFDSKDVPEKGVHVIPIDEQSFFPLQVRDHLIEIKKACADISKEFFETYGGKNVFSVHRQSFFSNNTPQRHHGIFIDVAKMLACPEFNQKLYASLEQVEVLPVCIIYPPHDQGKQFVDAIVAFFLNKFNQVPKTLCFADLEVEPEDKRLEIIAYLKSLGENELVFIVDDVSITGNRLSSYQMLLHDKFKGKIHYLVGVARPESDGDWERRRRILAHDHQRYTLTCIEKVLLPDWNRTTCPWCREKELLNEVTGSPNYEHLSVARQLQIRLNALGQAERFGLTDDVFFSINDTKKPVFLGGSIFCNKKAISEADLIASIAGSIQQLRNGYVGPKNIYYKLVAGHPLYGIIHPDDYLKGFEKLYEPLIKAALIRCCWNKELYATEDTNRQKQKEYIAGFLGGKRLNAANRSFFIYELYLAIKLGKLPKPAINENMRDILERFFNLPG